MSPGPGIDVHELSLDEFVDIISVEHCPLWLLFEVGYIDFDDPDTIPAILDNEETCNG